MTTDIRAHRDHRLTLYTHPLNDHGNSAQVYCASCDLFMTNLGTVTISIDNVTIRKDDQ